MQKIYEGQSALRITVKTFCDLEGAVSAVIKFRKPGGSKGELAAGIGDSANGVLFHECLEGEIDRSGWWVFWAFITFEDGRSAAGEACKLFVWREGG
jgi:hypothetical protein